VNTPLSHEQVIEQLPAVALDILDSAEQALLTEHVRVCAECGQLLRDYREVAGDLAHLIPSQGLDPARAALVRRQVVERVRQSKRGHSKIRFMAERWSGWMVAAGLAGVLLIHHGIHQPLAYGWLAAGVLLLVATVLGVYALVQRASLVALKDRLIAIEGGQKERD
jgi:hypothetical protein